MILIQACHSFAPNSSFMNLYHPRFLSNVIFCFKISHFLNYIFGIVKLNCQILRLYFSLFHFVNSIDIKMLRFGKIMSIVALRDLHPGEEILVSFLKFFGLLLFSYNFTCSYSYQTLYIIWNYI